MQVKKMRYFNGRREINLNNFHLNFFGTYRVVISIPGYDFLSSSSHFSGYVTLNFIYIGSTCCNYGAAVHFMCH